MALVTVLRAFAGFYAVKTLKALNTIYSTLKKANLRFSLSQENMKKGQTKALKS